jgi:hypothetical protein
MARPRPRLRLRLTTAALAAAALLASARAGAAPEEPVVPYIAAGSELHWVALPAPLAGERLGAIAAGEVDRARAVERGEAPRPQPRLEGDATLRAQPSDWAAAPLAGRKRGRAPLGARGLDGRCDCATPVGDERTERVAALFAQAGFTVGDEIDRVRLLHLRLRYTDGVVAYINGREVARRAIGPEAAPLALAAQASGGEWESFYVPTAGLLRRGENRLSIEVRPSAFARSPSLDLRLDGRSGARIVRGPIVRWTGPTGAVIAFDTDIPSRASVEYAIGKATRPRVAASAGRALAVRHEVPLPGLEPASSVRYRVVAGGDATPERTFYTAPRPGGVVRFGVYGDTRGGHAVHARLVASLLAEAPDFVVVTGDLVLRGSDEADWQRFFLVAGELLARVPFYLAVGNHDLGRAGDEQRRVDEVFAFPARPESANWYSFDAAGLHFVMLDSNAYGDERQLAWLRTDLAAARRAGARALFAVVHHGPYSRGPHGGSAIARDRYAPVLAASGVVLVFAGHDHIYQRGELNGLRYIVSGGGGAPLYPIRCGVRGRPRCDAPDGAAIAVSENHYLMVTVQGDYAQMCARRPDRTPLEGCVRYRIPPAR